MSKPRILCVHQSEQSWGELLKTLELAGYDVIAATNAEQALRMLSINAVDGVILDHLLDTRGGVHLRSHIRRLYPEMPTLLFSHPDEIYAMPLDVFRQYLETQNLPTLC